MSDERIPPERVRLSGLQEAQLSALQGVEQACAAAGLGAAAGQPPPRTLSEIVALTRDHDVYVVEADREVAGYLAWRDEPPGVACISQISVHPDLQRFGLGTRLLEHMQDRAWGYGIRYAVARVRQGASGAVAFFENAGFSPLGDDAPEKVRQWLEQQEAAGRPLAGTGQTVFWAPILPPEIDEGPTWDGSTGV